jgi:DeoR family fructose operon transcriptional repressor
LLADHSKFGVVKGTKHGDLDDIDVLISDKGLTDDQCAQLRTAGIDVERT